MKRMRTIQGLYSEIKKMDPETEISLNFIRQTLKGGKFKGFHKVGVKYLIDFDAFIEYLGAEQTEEKELIQLGKLRKVKA